MAFISPSSLWETVEYVGESFVIVACIGEYFAEFRKFPKNESQRENLRRSCVLLLIGGLAIGLLGLFKTTQLSKVEISKLRNESITNELQVAALTNENLQFRTLLAEIVSADTPRVLSASNQIEALRTLKRFAGVQVEIIRGDGDEAKRLAKQVEWLLGNAGWHTNSNNSTLAPDEGVVVAANVTGDGLNRSKVDTNTIIAAQTLCAELRRGGIAASFEDMRSLPSDMIAIGIGEKPNPLKQLQEGFPFFNPSSPYNKNQWEPKWTP
jgi:hypothetical protein